MKPVAACLCLLLLSCSNTFVPKAGQIRALESKLRTNLCIGDVKGWARTYWIDPEQRQRLRFSFGKPVDKWTKGVTIIPTHRWKRSVYFNDAPFAADGEYDLVSGKVTLNFCGPNR